MRLLRTQFALGRQRLKRGGEVPVHAAHTLAVNARLEARALQHFDDALRRVVSRSQNHGAHRRVHYIRTRFDGLHQTHHRNSGGAAPCT